MRRTLATAHSDVAVLAADVGRNVRERGLALVLGAAGLPNVVVQVAGRHAVDGDVIRQGQAFQPDQVLVDAVRLPTGVGEYRGNGLGPEEAHGGYDVQDRGLDTSAQADEVARLVGVVFRRDGERLAGWLHVLGSFSVGFRRVGVCWRAFWRVIVYC